MKNSPKERKKTRKEKRKQDYRKTTFGLTSSSTNRGLLHESINFSPCGRRNYTILYQMIGSMIRNFILLTCAGAVEFDISQSLSVDCCVTLPYIHLLDKLSFRAVNGSQPFRILVGGVAARLHQLLRDDVAPTSACEEENESKVQRGVMWYVVALSVITEEKCCFTEQAQDMIGMQLCTRLIRTCSCAPAKIFRIEMAKKQNVTASFKKKHVWSIPGFSPLQQSRPSIQRNAISVAKTRKPLSFILR